MKTLKAGALFSGIGGFCLGFGRRNIETVWAVERDMSANATYRANCPGATLISDDIRNVSVGRDDFGPVDVLHAGFPCQSFSQAGERKGFEDDRGKLFYEIMRIIGEFKDRKPPVLVLENAPYLLYGKGGEWFQEVQKAIQKAGYWFRDANCAELDVSTTTSVPQQRNRLFMVALSTDHFRNGRFAFPSSRSVSPQPLEEFIDFDGEKDDEYYLDLDNRYYKMIKSQKNGDHCVYQLRKYEVRPKEPGVCPTLTANMGLGGHNVPFIWDRRGLRKLTEYECLKLQGFPDSFGFPAEVARARRYHQVGNAVSVPVAEKLSEAVRAKLEGIGT